VAPDGSGPSIGRFAFGLDATGITEGREAPPLPPPLLAGGGLLVLAVLAGAASARGIALPRIDRSAGRVSLAAFSVVGGVLGAAIMAFGPRV